MCVCKKLSISERRACKVLGQARSTQRHNVQASDDEKRLVARIIELAEQYGRYGYRMITGLLQLEGWRVNHKRVERIWRQEGLKVPKRQPKRRRLWLNDGSCVRLRPQHKDHVWSYDFVAERTADGRAVRLLNIIDEYTRECLSIRVQRHISSDDVLDELSNLFIMRGIAEHIRSDNGSEFTAKAVRKWLGDLEVKTLYIEPGSPW
jgi:putative transposase